MITLSPLITALLGMLLAAWLVASVMAVLSGLKMRAAATDAARKADALGELLESGPAVPLLLRSDGRIEASERLAFWLGLNSLPGFLSELTAADGPLLPEDGERLAQEVTLAQRSGRSFSLAVRARGSSRSLLIKAVPARIDGESDDHLALWIFDATDSQSRIEQLNQEVSDYRETLEALTGLMEAAPMPIWFRGPDGQLQLVNSNYVQAVEATNAQQVIGGGIELVDSLDGLTPAAAAAQAADRGEQSSRDLPVTVAGNRRLMRVIDVPLGPQGVASYAIDLEELDSAQSELRRMRQVQRDMFDRLSAGVAQFGPDQRLRFCNQPFISMFSLAPDAVAPDSEFARVLDAMRDGGYVPEARDFPAWRTEHRQWFLSETAHDENWALRDGVHMRVVGQPLPDGGLLMIFEDRTEQVQLSSSRDTLLRVRTATFDNLFEAIGVFRADGRLHLWNRRFREVWAIEEAMLGEHPRVDEFVAAVAARLAKPQQASLVQQLIRAATNERRQRGGRIAFADGHYFEFAAIPLPDGNALFVMLDITDSRRIELALRDRNEALEEADRIKTAFVSNMSYELRTPLTSISGFAEMMEAGYAGTLSEQAHEYVRAIRASTDRLTHLIDNVLELTQGAAGGLAADREPVDLLVTARESIASHEEAARSAGVTLAFDFQDNVGSIMGDPRRIGQAIDHLLDSALGFAGQGGRVLVHGDGTAERARIIVSDNGPGMDEKTRARLLDVFRRFSHGIGGEMDGFGLLLARQLVEAHGGTLSIMSEPGAGTAITIELPR